MARMQFERKWIDGVEHYRLYIEEDWQRLSYQALVDRIEKQNQWFDYLIETAESNVKR